MIFRLSNEPDVISGLLLGDKGGGKTPTWQIAFGFFVPSRRIAERCTRNRNIVRLGEVTLARRVKLQRAYLGEAGPAVAELSSGGDEVLFGTTSECQVQLLAGYEGAKIVAAISLDPEDGCLLRNTTQDPTLVLVDGAPVYSIFKLEDGDLLDVAGDQFRVLIPRFSEQPPTPVVVAPPVEIPEPVIPKSSYELEKISGTTEFSSFGPADNLWSLDEVLDALLVKPGAFVFANFRGAKSRPGSGLETGEDLLSAAPEEIREMFSLHVIAEGELDQKKMVFRQLAARDCAVIVLPEVGDAQACVKSLKLYYGWLTKPSVLDFTLLKGSKSLTTEILKPIQLFLIAEIGRTPEWKICVKASADVQKIASLLQKT